MLGRAPRTKETLPDFCENIDPDKWDTTMWYRVTRNPHEFRRLTGCQREPRIWGVTDNQQAESRHFLQSCNFDKRHSFLQSRNSIHKSRNIDKPELQHYFFRVATLILQSRDIVKTRKFKVATLVVTLYHHREIDTQSRNISQISKNSESRHFFFRVVTYFLQSRDILQSQDISYDISN